MFFDVSHKGKPSRTQYLRNNIFFKTLVPAFFIATIGACSDGLPPSAPVLPVAPVSGKVTWGTEIPEGATVSLLPIERPAEQVGISSTGIVKKDGTFKISSYGKEDGAPLGEYAVVIKWFKFVATEGGGGSGPNVLPSKYASASTTPIKLTVKEGSNEIPPIVIPKK